jgi:drug/metabolite transporter (DMT)-like permease
LAFATGRTTSRLYSTVPFQFFICNSLPGFVVDPFAAFSTVLPYASLNFVKADEVSPTTEGTTLLLSPVLGIVWGIILFGQFVAPLQYIGAALILISALIILKG